MFSSTLELWTESAKVVEASRAQLERTRQNCATGRHTEGLGLRIERRRPTSRAATPTHLNPTPGQKGRTRVNRRDRPELGR